jgi:hypothetical protein
MKKNDFLAYVGDTEIHDASILSVAHSGDQVEVALKSVKGRVLKIVFTGTREIISREPIGMIVYSLTEVQWEPPFRKFVFTNANEDNLAILEIEAQSFNY